MKYIYTYIYIYIYLYLFIYIIIYRIFSVLLWRGEVKDGEGVTAHAACSPGEILLLPMVPAFPHIKAGWGGKAWKEVPCKYAIYESKFC